MVDDNKRRHKERSVRILHDKMIPLKFPDLV